MPSEAQSRFLNDAVDNLQEEGKITPVRLSLFAEMFKHRPWTVDELESVGGVAGVGEQFLESTFGEETSTVEFRGARRQIVQAILEEIEACQDQTDFVVAAVVDVEAEPKGRPRRQS